MKKRSVRKILCLLTATALMLASGCGGQDVPGEGTKGAQKSPAGEDSARGEEDAQGQEGSMGR